MDLSILKSVGHLFFNTAMTKIPYTKPAKTIPDQILELERKGLVVSNHSYATDVLTSINYYRLSGYWLYYEITRDVINPGTTFEQVMELYNFDKELRTLLFEGLSIFEITFKTIWAHEMGIKYGPQKFYDKNYCKDDRERLLNIKATKREIKRSREVFIQHNVNKYTGKLPAAWITCEVMSFGNLSCWYTNLKEVHSTNISSPGNAKDSIASFFGVDSHLLESWIHSLTVLRNQCAHQARIVNKKLTITPKKPKSKKSPIKNLWSSQSDCYYNLILVLVSLNKRTIATSNWLDEIKAFLKANATKCVDFLGFPSNWETEYFWL